MKRATTALLYILISISAGARPICDITCYDEFGVFTGQNRFGKCFKAKKGMTPPTYRKEARK